jgi:hypothetical protein
VQAFQSQHRTLVPRDDEAAWSAHEGRTRHAADLLSLPSYHRSSLERVGLRIKDVVTPDSEFTPPRRDPSSSPRRGNLKAYDRRAHGAELDYSAEEVESIQVGADRNTDSGRRPRTGVYVL